MNRNTVLILGANGRLGSAASTAFRAAGWRVLTQARHAGAGISIDLPLQDQGGLLRAAQGASAVVYAVNPPYTRWDSELLPLARLGMDLAQRLGATFMLPGNVYAYGEQMPAVLDELTPERPSNGKGALRKQMENEMRERALDPTAPLQSVVIRAGDFYGHGKGSWLDLVIAKKLAQGQITYPGPLDVPHAWAYLPDLARAFVAVAGAKNLAPHTRLHFGGHAPTGQELVAALRLSSAALGLPTPRPRVATLPWALLRAGGLVVPMWRELARMSYLWRRPHRLDGRALQRLVGDLPSAPLALALTAALAELGLGSLRAEVAVTTAQPATAATAATSATSG